MKKSNLLKNMILVSMLCGTVSVNAATSVNGNMSLNSNVGNLTSNTIKQPNWPLDANKSAYWPANFPALGSDSWFIVKDPYSIAPKFKGCGAAVDSGNPNYGTPTLDLNYNLIVNVQNSNSKLRYDVYSKVDNRFIYRNVALANGRNIISIQPSFINGKLLKDSSGDYLIIFKGIKYNGIYVNTKMELGMSLKNTIERGCQNDANLNENAMACGLNGGALFYHKGKLNTTLTNYNSIVSSTRVIPFEQGFSKLAYSGSSDPSSGHTCMNVYRDDAGVFYTLEHVVRLYASIDAYQMNLNGDMSSYANPHEDSASSAYAKTSVTYDLHQMLWQSK